MADGSIRIETVIDNKAAKAKLKELEKLLAETEGKKQKLNSSDEMTQLKNEMELERERYQQELAKAKTQQQINSIEREHAQLVEQIGIRHQGIVDKANQYAETIARCKQQMAGLQQSIQQNTAATSQTETATQQTESHASRLQSFFGGAKSAVRGIAKAMGGAALAGVRKLGSAIKTKLTNGLKNAITHIKNMGKSADGMRKKFLRIGAALLGMRGLMAGMRQIISSALSNNEQLQNQLNAIKGVLGQALAPAIQIVTNALGQIVTFVDKLYTMLTGTSLVAKYNASQAKKIAESTADAADSAKEYKRQMAGFDVANKLEDNSSSSSNNSGSSGSEAAMFETSELSDWAKNLISKIKSSWETADFTEVGEMIAAKIVSALKGINWDDIKKKAFGAGKSFATLLNGLFSYTDKDGESLTETIGKTLGESLNTMVQGALGFVENFDFKNFGTQLSKGLNKYLKTVDFGDMGKLLGDSIKGALDTAIGFLETFDWSQLAHKLEDFFGNIDYSGISSRLFEALGAALGGIASFLGTLLNDAFKNIKDYFDDSIDKAGGDVIAGIFNGIVNWLKDAGTWIKDNILTPFVNGFKKAFDIHSPSKDPTILQLGEDLIVGLFNGVVNWMKNIKTWLQTNVFDKITAAIGKAKTTAIEVIGKFKEDAKNKAAALKSKINSIKGKTSEIWAKFKEDAKNKKDALKKKIDAVKGKTVDITARFKDAITGVLNSLIGKINTLLGKLRGIGVAGIKPFKDIKDIPKLAKGGIVNNPGRGVNAIVGEAGPEAVLPLTDSVLGKLATLISDKQTGGNEKQIVIPVYLDGRQIAKYTIDTMNKQAFELNRGGAY